MIPFKNLLRFKKRKKYLLFEYAYVFAKILSFITTIKNKIIETGKIGDITNIITYVCLFSVK